VRHWLALSTCDPRRREVMSEVRELIMSEVRELIDAELDSDVH
jgi:hypothetical protein